MAWKLYLQCSWISLSSSTLLDIIPLRLLSGLFSYLKFMKTLTLIGEQFQAFAIFHIHLNYFFIEKNEHSHYFKFILSQVAMFKLFLGKMMIKFLYIPFNFGCSTERMKGHLRRMYFLFIWIFGCFNASLSFKEKDVKSFINN